MKQLQFLLSEGMLILAKKEMNETIYGKTYQQQLGRVKRIWYLLAMRAAKVQASLRIRAVSPESPLLAHASSESRGTFRQKARSLAHLNGWAWPVKICHDGMLEDTNLLDAPQFIIAYRINALLSAYIIRQEICFVASFWWYENVIAQGLICSSTYQCHIPTRFISRCQYWSSIDESVCVSLSVCLSVHVCQDFSINCVCVCVPSLKTIVQTKGALSVNF